MKKFYRVLPFVVARIEREGKVLIGRQPNLPGKPYPLRWDLPGGKMEKHESPADCLRREVKEETGFRVVDFRLSAVYHHHGDDPECTNDIPSLGIGYRVTVSGEFSPAEMDQMHWVNPEELRQLKLTPWTADFLSDLL